MKVTLENLQSAVCRKVVFIIGEPDSADIEEGKIQDTYGELEITFSSGRTYDYHKVSMETFSEMMTSTSLGRYLNLEIKPNHKFTETTDPEVVARIVADQQFRKALKASLV
jgi:hypothetical protein